jgi:adenylate cyclase
MSRPFIAADAVASLAAWLTEAGLCGSSEDAIVVGFCERAVAAGLPIGRSLAFIDTLHPVYEGRVVRWGHDASVPVMQEYGRTRAIGGGPDPADLRVGIEAEMLARWRASPFMRLLDTGESVLRWRAEDGEPQFSVIREYRDEGFTDYVAIVSRFGEGGTIGEMDALYSSFTTTRAGGFDDAQFAALLALVPTLALAVKSVAMARMTRTLMHTYLGRDAGEKVLSGRIMRGVAERIDAVIWFSDLRGFTRITDTAPEHIIPLLNDYADVIVSAIQAEGGDVLKLVGDGILAIFTGADRPQACAAAINAAIAARRDVAVLNQQRAADGQPTTAMYLGLNVGPVLYGNIGSTERLDFTVVGPAVNEASRIAAMCRSVEQPILVSQAFADIDGVREALVSVGRFALRGVGRPQELFTLDFLKDG